jgi:hypothetical protein
VKNGLRAFDSGGVLEKFPNLRVAFLEGNCAWLPWLLYRLDERAKLHGPLADVPLSKKPSEYFLRLMSELPQQFPKLRWGFIEASAQWVPWIYRSRDSLRSKRPDVPEEHFRGVQGLRHVPDQ